MLSIYNNCSECKNRSICKYYGVTERAKGTINKAISEDKEINTLNIRVSCDMYIKSENNPVYRNSFNV